MKQCSFEGCDKKHRAKGYCGGHRAQMLRGGILKPLRRPMTKCSFNECERPHFSKGYCRNHYYQFKNGSELKSITRSRQSQALPIDTMCSVQNCCNARHAKGFCTTHYARFLRHGHTDPTRGFGHIDPKGYRYIRVNGKPIMEHRFLMEEFIGRSLLKCENVHHLNGNRSDNRIENLELWSTSQPPGQRIKDKIEWAKEILTFYGEEGSLWDVQA